MLNGCDNIMEIVSARFLQGVTGTEGLPKPSLPTIAFFGRSNVGKSSVINSLVREKGLARSSVKQGKTTEINYYIINDAWYFADLPGYGYAKLPPKKRDKIGKYLSWYAETKEINLIWAVIIVDAEVGAKDSDRETYELLREYGRNIVIVANKSDKGRRHDIINNIKAIRRDFPGCQVVRYSTKTGEGRRELLNIIFSNTDLNMYPYDRAKTV